MSDPIPQLQPSCAALARHLFTVTPRYRLRARMRNPGPSRRDHPTSVVEALRGTDDTFGADESSRMCLHVKVRGAHRWLPWLRTAAAQHRIEGRGSAGWTRKRLADFLRDAALVKRFTEFARRVDLVKRVTEFVRDAAVVAVIQRVAGGENQCDWPVDDLSGSQHRKADVVREFLWAGKLRRARRLGDRRATVSVSRTRCAAVLCVAVRCAEPRVDVFRVVCRVDSFDAISRSRFECRK